VNKRQRFRCRCLAGVLVLPLLAAGNVFAPVAAAPGAQTTAGRKRLPAAAGALLVVRGTVKALTRPPRPGSVPYKDALVSLHLVGAKAVRSGRAKLPGRAGGGLLVYVWGMRNNKLTPAAYLRPGQTVTLALRPWEAVEERYDGYNRREFDNDDLLVLPTFWGEPAAAAAARP